MYQEFFGLRDAPFSIAPNPHYLYMSKQHHEALAHLVYGVGRDGGFVLLTGEVGTGKTTICRCFLEQIPDDTDVAFILNPKLNAEQLLATICDELAISYFDDDMSIKTLVDCINDYLLKSHAKGRHTVLIIDEAQNLSPEVLEQLRLLTNLETHEKKLLQIVLLGQPELQDMFLRPDLRQLAQRVTARFHLKELQPGEIGPYVRHRLGVAGGRDIVGIFPDKTLKRLYAITAGVPRVINLVCDRAMLGAYAQNQRSVDVRTLELAAREILGPSFPAVVKTPAWMKSLVSARTLAWGLALASVGLLFWGAQRVQVNIAITPQSAPAGEVAGKILRTNSETNGMSGDTVPGVATELTALTSTIRPTEDKPGGEGSPETESATDHHATPAVLDALSTQAQPTAAAPTEAGIGVTTNDSGSAVTVTTLQALLETDKPLDEITALRDLFALWGASPTATLPARACQQVRKEGLQCLSRSGSLGFLRHLGLPAVVTLHSQEGRRYFAVLRSLENGKATLQFGPQQVELPEDVFNQVWRGQFTMLWRSPREYSGPLQPGAVSPMSRWLRQAFATLDQRPLESASAFYDPPLVERVKTFQREVGEIDDGIVGEATLIHLTRRLERSVPLLTQGETQ